MEAKEDELERFLKDFSKREREFLKSWPEYQKALVDGKITTAIEVASIILLNGQGTVETRKMLKKHFPDL